DRCVDRRSADGLSHANADGHSPLPEGEHRDLENDGRDDDAGSQPSRGLKIASNGGDGNRYQCNESVRQTYLGDSTQMKHVDSPQLVAAAERRQQAGEARKRDAERRDRNEERRLSDHSRIPAPPAAKVACLVIRATGPGYCVSLFTPLPAGGRSWPSFTRCSTRL